MAFLEELAAMEVRASRTNWKVDQWGEENWRNRREIEKKEWWWFKRKRKTNLV